MSLHNGVDLVAVATVGVFSKTYGSTETGNTANLFVSLGLLEDAPEASTPLFTRIRETFWWLRPILPPWVREAMGG